jgi:hypothetical protein
LFIEHLACYTVIFSTCSADRGKLVVVLSKEFILLITSFWTSNKMPH